MASLPFIFWLVINYLVAGHVAVKVMATRELIFFELSTFSSGAFALVETAQRPWSRFLFYMAVVCALLAAVLYGTFLTGEALHAAGLVRRAYHFSIIGVWVALTFSAFVNHLTKPRSSHNGSER